MNTGSNITASYSASVSGSFEYSGIKYTISAGISKGVGISVPANSKRFSRLGFEVDVQLKEYKIEMYDTSQRNKVIHTMNIKRPVVINTYNVVKYQ